jgi:hypothetical protein
MEERLLDGWCATGKDIEDFKKEVRELSSYTYTELLRKKDLTILSNTETPDPNHLKFYLLKPDSIWDTASGRLTLRESKMKRGDFDAKGIKKLVSELETSTKMLLMADGKVYFTSYDMLSTLGLRTNLAGDSILHPSLERDIYFARCLDSDEELTAIIRRQDGVRKIFSTLSAKYPYVPQSFCADILDRVQTEGKLGNAVGYNWKVDNTFAEIYVEFPDKASELMAIYGLDRAVTPGLFICKSDVGESSIVVRATWRIGNSVILLDEFRRKHSGKIDVNEILEGIDEIVFSKYTLLPEKLCDLMGQNILDKDAKKTLSVSKFRSLNKKTVEGIIKSVFKEIKLVDATTKSIEKELYEALCDEIDYDIEYTAYDICMMIMTLPERKILGMPEAYKTPLAKACGKAAYCKYELKAKSKVKLAV